MTMMISVNIPVLMLKGQCKYNDLKYIGRSPGLVVMGDDSWSRGCGLVYCMELTFFTLICCKYCIDVCLKRPKRNEKEAGAGSFF